MEPITITTTVNVSANDAWENYLNPEHVVKWSFASDDWECTSSENDLRVGGNFSNHLAAKDRSFEFDFAGTYTEVVPDKRVAYALGDARNVTVDFESVGENQTKVTVVFDPEDQNPIKSQRDGWQAFLDNYKRYVGNVASD